MNCGERANAFPSQISWNASPARRPTGNELRRDWVVGASVSFIAAAESARVSSSGRGVGWVWGVPRHWLLRRGMLWVVRDGGEGGMNWDWGTHPGDVARRGRVAGSRFERAITGCGAGAADGCADGRGDGSGGRGGGTAAAVAGSGAAGVSGAALQCAGGAGVRVLGAALCARPRDAASRRDGGARGRRVSLAARYNASCGGVDTESGARGARVPVPGGAGASRARARGARASAAAGPSAGRAESR